MQWRWSGFAAWAVLAAVSWGGGAYAQGGGRARGGGQPPAYVPEDHRPPLFLREDWKHVPPPDFPVAVGERPLVAYPLSQNAVTAPHVDVKIYGETKQGVGPDSGVMVSHHDSPKDDPTFIYMGGCLTPCAVALRDRDNYVDLTGLAKIRWRTKQNGFHQVHLIVKLADGTWLVGDYGQAATTDWNENEFSIIDVRWRYFSVDKVVTMKSPDWVLDPDLKKVDEIGFTDLMPGNLADGGHGSAGTSRVDWIEVYGNPVKRDSSNSN